MTCLIEQFCDIYQYLEHFNFIDLCPIELLEIKFFDGVTVCIYNNNNGIFDIRMGRVFANGPGDLGSIPVTSYQRLLKW